MKGGFGSPTPRRALAAAAIVSALGSGIAVVVNRGDDDSARHGTLTRAVAGVGDGSLRAMQERGQAVTDRAASRLHALYADAAIAAGRERAALARLAIPPALRADADRLADSLARQEVALRALAAALREGDRDAQAVHAGDVDRAAAAVAVHRGRLTHRLRPAA